MMTSNTEQEDAPGVESPTKAKTDAKAKAKESEETTPSYRVGFDLGGTKMLAVLYDDQWNQVGRRRKRTKSGDAKAGVKRILQVIGDLLEEADIAPEQVATIGLGCPGPVDLNAGIVREAVNLTWENVKLKTALEDEFPAQAEVLNDVDAGVYGEYQFGAAKDARTAVGVFPGTGIGGGAVYDGQVLSGKSISCMEIGHVQVQLDGPLCGCGASGCLETVASRLAIAAEAAKAVFRGEAPVLKELVGTTVSDIRSGALAKSVEGGDKVVEQIIRTAARRVGQALAGVIHLLAPDEIVLGGGLVEAMPKLWVKEVKDAAQGAVMKPYRDTFRVVEAVLGDDAAVLGAAAWADHQWKAN